MTRKERNADRRAAKAKMELHYAATSAAVAANRCPSCGRGLRRNASLTGWWQCEQYGAVRFRKDATQPACDWQGFTKM